MLDTSAVAVGPAAGRRLHRAARRVAPRWRMPLLVTVGCQVVWLFYWAAFYPGLLSFDSVMYTWQVTTGHWTSDHSVLYDAMVWLALHLPGKFALLTLAQTTAMSVALGYACAAVRDLGVRARWCATAALATAVLPPTGTFVVFVWKDVPFTISALLVFAAAARLVARRGTAMEPGRWLRPGGYRFDLLVFSAGLLGLGLFRNNGLIVALLAGLVLLPFLPGLRKSLAALTLVAVVLPGAAQLGGYRMLGVAQPPANSVFGMNYADIAVAYKEVPWVFSGADRRLLAEVAPMSTWEIGSNCRTADLLSNSGAPFDRQAAQQHNDELVGLWMKVFKKRPDVLVDARLCRGAIAWDPFSDWSVDAGATIIAPLERPGDLWGWAASSGTARPEAGAVQITGRMADSPYLPALRSHPLSKRLNLAATWFTELSKARHFDTLLWRGATWTYLAYAALACYAMGRRNRAVWGTAGVLLGMQLMLMVSTPAGLFRYNVAPLFIGPLCLGLFAAARQVRGRK
ncbi:hypothetical protein [Streptomyces sp. NRRL B-24484]|uniref:hypothetical protein n=1 Tax=Streptomyces sp. NRRL B-24484 TaxID=1463833 RepID=UPI0004C174E2|nr:hypothetical protein [Streptomyces sp. NRRL B-24484]